MRNTILFFLAIYILSCNQPQPKKLAVTIGIQPLGKFDESLIDSLSKTITKVYGFQCTVFPVKPMPKEAFINTKVPRYRADWLIHYLNETIPDSVYYLIGLTEFDISTTKKDGFGRTKKPISNYTDWGVFGLGYCPGPTCIVSTKRLKTDNRLIFLERFRKICIHELGHNLGLEHCTTEKCVMQDAAETIKTIDNVNLEICEKCKLKIAQ